MLLARDFFYHSLTRKCCRHHSTWLNEVKTLTNLQPVTNYISSRRVAHLNSIGYRKTKFANALRFYVFVCIWCEHGKTRS